MKPPLIDGKPVLRNGTPMLDALALKIGWFVIIVMIGAVLYGLFWLICAAEGSFMEWLAPVRK